MCPSLCSCRAWHNPSSSPRCPKSSILVSLNIVLPCAVTNRCESRFLASLLVTFSHLLSVPSSLFPVHCDRTSRAIEVGVEGAVSTLDDDPAITTPTPPAFSASAEDPRLECPSPKMATRHRQARCTHGRQWLFLMPVNPSFAYLLRNVLPLACRPPDLELECHQDLCRPCNSHILLIVKAVRHPFPCINPALKRLYRWPISKAPPASHSTHLSLSRNSHSTTRFLSRLQAPVKTR
jgi:hypothetical protein